VQHKRDRDVIRDHGLEPAAPGTADDEQGVAVDEQGGRRA
jgi:hypothetical protein